MRTENPLDTSGPISTPVIDEGPHGWIITFNVKNYGGRACYQADDIFLADLDVQLAKWRRRLVAKMKYG